MEFPLTLPGEVTAVLAVLVAPSAKEKLSRGKRIAWLCSAHSVLEGAYSQSSGLLSGLR